jgi:hypothetical protein
MVGRANRAQKYKKNPLAYYTNRTIIRHSGSLYLAKNSINNSLTRNVNGQSTDFAFNIINL